jgi:phosphate:Na+ symporter
MSQLLLLLGGLGIFLLGVVIMTNGLKGLAGDLLRSALTNFTRSPGSGALTGAISTALLQSSSATTVAAVGFVGAGLLTFPQALGIVFGANIGTTATGWLVALLGFKFKLGTAVLPLILLGILMHLFGKARIAQGGLALAGFSLIFVGIGTMQTGMGGLEESFVPALFEADTLAGRFKLLLLGVVITLLTQSSSAGVATALTALYTGTINFEQAAAMVIGMDIGTTATAAFATLGGSVDSRRTGYSHVIYNLMTGTGAFFLLTPYVMFLHWYSPTALSDQAEIALVAFHTAFNLLGVVVVLPFTAPFSRLIERLVPDHAAPMVKRLDRQLLKEPAVALEAVRETLNDISHELFSYGQALLQHSPDARAARLDALGNALNVLQAYVDHIHLTPEVEREWNFLMACIHALDHMHRLHRRYQRIDLNGPWKHWPVLRKDLDEMTAFMGMLEKTAAKGQWAIAAEQAAALFKKYESQMDTQREQIIFRIASGKQDTVNGNLELETARWLGRVSKHLWRIVHHLSQAEGSSYKPTGATDTHRANHP